MTQPNTPSNPLAQQFYDHIREAMQLQQMTVSDLAARRGVHYSYIYNAIRQTQNLTMESAAALANAAGYDITFSFTPRGDAPDLTGKPPTEKFFSRRAKSKKAAAKADAALDAPVIPAMETPKPVAAALPPVDELEAELNELLSEGE